MDCKAAFGFFNLVDQTTTTVTAPSENALYPASNLQHPFSTKVFRSTTASANIVFDFITVEEVNALMIRPSAQSGWGFNGDLTIEANSVDSWGSPAYSTTLTKNSSEDFSAMFLDTAKSYRFWRISGSGTSYFELSNIFLGSYFQPAKNVSYGWQWVDTDLSTKRSNSEGQYFIDEHTSTKEVDISIKVLSGSEKELLDDQLSYVKTTKPIWLVIDPEECISSSKNIFAGVFYVDKVPSYTNIAFNLFNTGMKLKECK